MYLKKFAALAAILVAGIASSARADFFTEQATIDVNAPGDAVAAPLIDGITVFQGTGRLYTNLYNANGDGTFDLRTIGILTLDNVEVDGGTTYTGVRGPGDLTSRLVIAFAIDGRTTLGDTNTATFTSGGFGIWERPAGAINTQDLTTWFADIDAPVYLASLADQTDAFVGFGASIDGALPGTQVVDSSLINFSARNFANAGMAQAWFLFNELADPATLPYGGTQSEFLNVTTNYGATVGLANGPESVLSAVSSVGTNGGISFTDFINTAAEEGIANHLAGLLGLSDLGGGSYFATFGSGDIKDYIPVSSATGDFTQTIQAISYPGINAVPEPGTLALLGTGSLVMGLYGRRRKAARKVS